MRASAGSADLQLRYQDPPRLLEQFLVTPVRIEVAEFPRQPVVLPHPDGVVHGEAGLLVAPAVPRLETLPLRPGRAFCTVQYT